MELQQTDSNIRKDIIPLWQLESAISEGWEVTGYSEYKNGIPQFADVQKPTGA